MAEAYSLLNPNDDVELAEALRSNSDGIYPDSDAISRHVSGKLGGSNLVRTVSRTVDRTIQFSSATNEGHKGAVLCVDASSDGAIIITGGEDKTLRVWRYFDDTYQCFRLVSVLVHAGQVTNNAFVGSKGPVVGADSTGAFVVWPMDDALNVGRTQSTYHPTHGQPIREVSVKKALSEDGSIFVATASGSDGRLHAASTADGTRYTFKSMAHLRHDEEVLHIKHIPGSVMEGAAVVTCTQKGVYLWSQDGDLLVTLTQPHSADNTSFAISTLEGTDDYFFLLASAGSFVSVWAVHRGHLVSGDGVACAKGDSPPPLVQYDISTKVTGVAIGTDKDFKHFMVVAKADQAKNLYSSEMFHITPSQAWRALGPHKPASLLAKDLETSVFEVVHEGDVRAITVYIDPDKEATLLEAFSNGLAAAWDLGGVDVGEITIELRSLTPVEVLLPIVLLLVSFFQVSSFAFGPNTNWSDEVQKPANFTTSIAFIDFEMMLTIDSQWIFWPEILGALGLMVLFILLSVFGVPEAVGRCRRAANRRHYTRGAQVLRVFEVTVKSVMALVATILVVPVFTAVAKSFDCVERQEGGELTIREAPGIICYEGRHQILVWAICAIGPCFFLVLMPHFCVQGDTQYVSPSQLVRPWLWQPSVERQASTVYFHSMHPHAENVFLNRMLELYAKIALPCITILLRARPRMQMSVVAVIGAFLYLQSLGHPALADPVWAAAKACSHLFTFVAMVCGLASTILPDYREWTAVWLLCGETIVLLIGAAHLRMGSRRREARGVVVETNTGDVEEESQDSLACSASAKEKEPLAPSTAQGEAEASCFAAREGSARDLTRDLTIEATEVANSCQP